MHTRAMRVLRGSLAAFFATFTAAFSHQFAGGVSPSLFGMGVSLVISITICTLLAGRTVSLARLSIAVLMSQAMYHTLFSAMLAPEGIARHDMAAMSFDFSSVAQSADSAMSLSHVAAAAITIAVFRYAELAFWGLFDTARMFVSRLFGTLCLTARPVLEFRMLPPTTLAVDLVARFLSTTRYRGPPAAFTAA